MLTIRSIGRLAASAYCATAAVFVLMSGPVAAQASGPIVSQSPLSLGGNVPGNVLLTPSVEYSTIDSMANVSNYGAAQTFVGYFDPEKCYQYQYDALDEDNNHFYPTSLASSHACSGAAEWSGNYLNWATTHTIDPFRKALTGGYRVRDEVDETWLEKARSDNKSLQTHFPNRSVPNAAIAGATPAAWTGFETRISRLGNRMLFARRDNGLGNEDAAFAGTSTPYGGGTLSDTSDDLVYEVFIRVKVCDPAVSLEANCVSYGSGYYKPEGLIQKYSDRIRFSAFGYLNDSDPLRDGGVLRAQQKFVGPEVSTFTSGVGWDSSENDNLEWNIATGQFLPNPDNAAIGNSGVINYINKFGQLTPEDHKSYDPVSELYYTALRYLKAQGDIAAYSDLTGTSSVIHNLADGFPVITDWDDPIQFSCQNNVILGIGGANTDRDKNLPGSTSGVEEPTKPTSVINDNTVDARTVTDKVAQLEGLTINTGATAWTGNYNSAFIAGLAYDAHTKDLRTDLDGTQTVSTYWIDVREGQVLKSRAQNPFWLAAKYGGFKVPPNFSPYATTTTSIPAATWQSGETLSNGDPRPENFYVATEADKMIESLTRAFANIAARSTGSASSLASNSTRLDTETRTFQAQFRSGIWGGELNAYSVLSNGELSALPIWNASDDMLGNGTGAIIWSGRKILSNDSGTLEDFTFANLNTTQRAALISTSTLTGANPDDIVDYLRGERIREESNENGYLRVRDSILGDIVNSTPLFIGPPNPAQHDGASYQGGATYASWATAVARVNRTPVVYVGSNDGMLHAFNATSSATVGGKEVFAFIPNTVIDSPLKLKQFAIPGYEHQFYVDGESAAADIYDASTSTWKTVLVGSLGRGGPGIFALDVTVPESPILMWEKTGTDIPQLGKNIGRPVIAQVADGDWRVLLGNGPDSGDGSAHLITIKLDSTAAVTTFSPNDATTADGMTALLVRDSSDADVFADTAYAGDLKGNVWKFTGIGGSVTATKLFAAVDPDGVAQPITAAPMIGRDPAGGQIWVFVGTGKYLHESDVNASQVETWYGLKDMGTLLTRTDLVERSILSETTIGSVEARVIEEGASGDMAGKKGWFIDLVSPVNGEEGERMVVQNRFAGQALVGTTRIPGYTDPCEPGGRGFIMAISPFTGARLPNTYFDINGDGLSNDSDKICDSSGCVPVSGIGFDSSPNNPIFIEDVMQVGLDDGTTEAIKTFGSAVQAGRLSWRELFNN